MTFFKVIKNDTVIDAGCAFLKWNDKKNRYFVCAVEEAEFALSYKEQNIYRDDWMKVASNKATGFVNAKVEIIEEQEYEDLLDLLSENEVIVIEKPVVNVPKTHEVVPEEKPLSLNELRELVKEQQKQIEYLTNKVKE